MNVLHLKNSADSIFIFLSKKIVYFPLERCVYRSHFALIILFVDRF